MPEPDDQDLADILERARSRLRAGEVIVEHSAEVELHSPMVHWFREPLELTPEVEAILRERLGPSPS